MRAYSVKIQATTTFMLIHSVMDKVINVLGSGPDTSMAYNKLLISTSKVKSIFNQHRSSRYAQRYLMPLAKITKQSQQRMYESARKSLALNTMRLLLTQSKATSKDIAQNEWNGHQMNGTVTLCRTEQRMANDKSKELLNEILPASDQIQDENRILNCISVVCSSSGKNFSTGVISLQCPTNTNNSSTHL